MLLQLVTVTSNYKRTQHYKLVAGVVFVEFIGSWDLDFPILPRTSY